MLAVHTIENEILFVKDDRIEFVSSKTIAPESEVENITLLRFVPKNGPARGKVLHVPLARVSGITDKTPQSRTGKNYTHRGYAD